MPSEFFQTIKDTLTGLEHRYYFSGDRYLKEDLKRLVRAKNEIDFEQELNAIADNIRLKDNDMAPWHYPENIFLEKKEFETLKSYAALQLMQMYVDDFKPEDAQEFINTKDNKKAEEWLKKKCGEDVFEWSLKDKKIEIFMPWFKEIQEHRRTLKKIDQFKNDFDLAHHVLESSLSSTTIKLESTLRALKTVQSSIDELEKLLKQDYLKKDTYQGDREQFTKDLEGMREKVVSFKQGTIDKENFFEESLEGFKKENNPTALYHLAELAKLTEKNQYVAAIERDAQVLEFQHLVYDARLERNTIRQLTTEESDKNRAKVETKQCLGNLQAYYKKAITIKNQMLKDKSFNEEQQAQFDIIKNALQEGETEAFKFFYEEAVRTKSPINEETYPKKRILPPKAKLANTIMEGDSGVFTDKRISVAELLQGVPEGENELSVAAQRGSGSFKGVYLNDDQVIRSTANFSDGKRGVLIQDKAGKVTDITKRLQGEGQDRAQELSPAQKQQMAFKMAKMLLSNYKPGDGNIVIRGGDAAQANSVYAALLVLKEALPNAKKIEIQSLVAGCNGPDNPKDSKSRNAFISEHLNRLPSASGSVSFFDTEKKALSALLKSQNARQKDVAGLKQKLEKLKGKSAEDTPETKHLGERILKTELKEDDDVSPRPK